MAKNLIAVLMTGDAKGVVKAAGEAKAALGEVETKSGSTVKNLAKYGAAAAAGVATVALAAGAYAVKVGATLQDSQDNLKNALKDTGQSMKDLGAGYEPLLKQNEKWGNTNAEVNDSLQTLIRSGVKSKDALKDESLAANFAAARHISLAAATMIVTKVTTGHVSLLGRYGIATKDAEGKTLSSAAALELLGQKYGGAADAAGSTFQGKIAAAKAQLTDTAAQIGIKLIPILEALMSFIAGTLIPGIEMIVAWVQTKLIPSLVAFGKTAAELYTKYVKPTVDGIITYFKGLFQEIDGVVHLFSDLFHGKWGAVWNDLKQIVSGVIESCVGFFKAFPGRILALIPGIAGAAVKAGASIASGILHGITGAAGDVANFAKSIVNGLIGYINRDVIDKIDSAIGDVSISFFGHHIGLPKHIIPDIPTLHSGGIFNSGNGEGLALLQDGERVLSRAETASYGGSTIINFPSGVSPSVVNAAQRRWDRRNGPAGAF